MRYWGSVKFYKNLILLVVIILILVPTIFCFKNLNKVKKLEEELEHAYLLIERYQEEQKLVEESVISIVEDTSNFSYDNLYKSLVAPQKLNASVSRDGDIFFMFKESDQTISEDIIDILDVQNIKASFFINSYALDTESEYLKNIIKKGHCVGLDLENDTFNKVTSVEDFLSEFNDLFIKVKENLNYSPTFFLVPNIKDNELKTNILCEMLRRGFVPCEYNINANKIDENQLTSEQIINNIKEDSKGLNRFFILVNEKIEVIDALPKVIDLLKVRGKQFVSLTPEIEPVIYSFN